MVNMICANEIAVALRPKSAWKPVVLMGPCNTICAWSENVVDRYIRAQLTFLNLE